MQDSHIHIGSLYQLFLDETQPFRKVHRMIDLFESIIKSHSVVILSEYVNHNQLSEAAKGMLSCVHHHWVLGNFLPGFCLKN
jgi:hypothetical protein